MNSLERNWVCWNAFSHSFTKKDGDKLFNKPRNWIFLGCDHTGKRLSCRVSARRANHPRFNLLKAQGAGDVKNLTLNNGNPLLFLVNITGIDRPEIWQSFMCSVFIWICLSEWPFSSSSFSCSWFFPIHSNLSGVASHWSFVAIDYYICYYLQDSLKHIITHLDLIHFIRKS